MEKIRKLLVKKGKNESMEIMLIWFYSYLDMSGFKKRLNRRQEVQDYYILRETQTTYPTNWHAKIGGQLEPFVEPAKEVFTFIDVSQEI